MCFIRYPNSVFASIAKFSAIIFFYLFFFPVEPIAIPMIEKDVFSLIEIQLSLSNVLNMFVLEEIQYYHQARSLTISSPQNWNTIN